MITPGPPPKFHGARDILHQLTPAGRLTPDLLHAVASPQGHTGRSEPLRPPPRDPVWHQSPSEASLGPPRVGGGFALVGCRLGWGGGGSGPRLTSGLAATPRIRMVVGGLSWAF